jgi:hypothetical protein
LSEEFERPATNGWYTLSGVTVKFNLKDYFVFFVCICVLAVSSYYLYLDFNSKPGIRGGEKQGYITFKYKVAQRKFPSRMIWEDVEQMLPIYNHDSIRTDSLSEAIVTLDNGVKIELDPDSMFVLNIQDKIVNVMLEKGSVLLSTTKALSNPNEFFLNYKNTKLSFQENNGQFKVLENQDSLEIVSSKGGTVIANGTSKETIFEKQKAKFEFATGKLDKVDLGNFDMQPAHNTRYFTDENVKEVLFEWKSKSGDEIQIDICQDRLFQEKVLSFKSKENRLAKEFTEGIYYWKLKSADGDVSETRKFRIIKNPPLKLIAPSENLQIKTKTGERLVNFIWSKRELALSYHFEISNDPSFKNLLVARNVFKTKISVPLGLGKYYWRIRSVDSIPGANSKTGIYTFTIEKEETLEQSSNSIEEEIPKAEEKPLPIADNSNKPLEEAPLKIKESPQNKIANPTLLFPRNNSVVDMNKLDSIPFKWSTVAGAKSYSLKFMHQSSGEILLQKDTVAPNYNFTQLDKLDVGNFSWTVEAIPGLETAEKGISTGKFSITLGEQPAAPEAISKGKKEEQILTDPNPQ